MRAMKGVKIVPLITAVAVTTTAACLIVLAASVTVDLTLVPAGPFESCKKKKKPRANQMTVQLQKNVVPSPTIERSVFAPARRGVTVAQVQAELATLYAAAKAGEAAPWFPFNRNEGALVGAIVNASVRLNRYPPLGIAQVGNLFSVNFANNKFRVDVENRFGHNLRFRV